MDLAERVLFKEEGIGCFFCFFLQCVIPWAGIEPWRGKSAIQSGLYFTLFRLYGRWQEGTFNEYYLSDILEMSRRVQRPHCFPLRCDVRFRISPADIVKPYRGSAGLVTAPNLVRCAALNSYLSATAAAGPSKAVTGWTIDSSVSNGTELTGPALHNLTRNELWQKQTGGLRIIPITALPPTPASACSPPSQTFPPPRRLLLFAVRFNINLPSPAQHRQHQVNFPIHNLPPLSRR